MINLSSEMIEQIVQSVMRELQARETPGGSSARTENALQPAGSKADTTVSSSSGLSDAQKPDPLTAAPVVISGHVISEHVLASANVAGKQIVISPGAVFTPSGRDFVRKNGVRLSSKLAGQSEMAGSGLLVLIGNAPTATAAAASVGWKVETAKTEHEAATIAESHLQKQVVACMGGEPSLVACLLNRNPSVRAAVVTKNTSMAVLGKSMNPHVVCFESAGWSFAETMRLLKSLRKSSAAPAGWMELRAGAAR